jgi:polar amino acid transport system ATP-binding protein
MAVLEVSKLKKSFDGAWVLKGIDFSLEKGESLAIIGASGSGKTTLLRCLNFLEIADGGTITVGGQVLFDGDNPSTFTDREIRRKRLHFGLVFQSFNLFPQYTALQNVKLAGELLAKERPDYKENRKRILSDIEDNARVLLDQVGLSDKLCFYPHQLSGGQQQRGGHRQGTGAEPGHPLF